MSPTLSVRLVGDQEIHMTRVFDAPRRLVIHAMTTPALLKRWLGGVRGTLTDAQVDLRVGGQYRYEFANPDGSSFFFTGEYREISDDRVVFTQLFNGDPSTPAIVTTTYVEQAGKTTMTVVMHLPTKDVRDAIVATGMSDGAGESYDVLAELLATL